VLGACLFLRLTRLKRGNLSLILGSDALAVR
jgi:hypothetical protein